MAASQLRAKPQNSESRRCVDDPQISCCQRIFWPFVSDRAAGVPSSTRLAGFTMSDERAAKWRLTAPQLGVWLAQHLDPECTMYNTAEYIDIDGPVDEGLLERAVRQVAHEAEPLNVRIVDQGSGPHQQLLSLQRDFEKVDLSDADDPLGAAVSWMDGDRVKPFSLVSGPLVGHALLKLGASRYLWYVKAHHIVIDAFGLSLIFDRAAHIYTALAARIDVPAAAFGSVEQLVRDDVEYRGSPDFEKDREYWREQVGFPSEPVTLSDRSASPSNCALRRTGFLSVSTFKRLKASARQARTNWQAAVIGILAAYVRRCSGAESATVGLAVTGRVNPHMHSNPGMMANIVPVRIDFPANITLGETFFGASQEARKALKHRRYPNEDMRRHLAGPARERRLYGPVVNIKPFVHDLDFAGVKGVMQNISNGPVGDFAITVSELGDGRVRIDFDANPKIYDEVELEKHTSELLDLIEELAKADLRMTVGSLEGADPEQSLRLWNATTTSFPDDRMLHELFEDQAARSPSSTALVFEGVTVSYAQLDRSANQLANVLVRKGVQPDSPVGVWMDRSIEMVVALLAVLKAGGAFVPLDPDLPASRAAQILDGSGTGLCLTQGELADRATGMACHAMVVNLADLADEPTQKPQIRLHPENLVSIYHTSGSTGAPKGVCSTHSGWVNRMSWMQADKPIGEGDAVLQKTVLSFDDSSVEVFWPLIVGARLVLLAPGLHRDPAAILHASRKHGITVLHFVPTMLKLFLDEVSGDSLAELANLRHVISSGEALSAVLVRQFFDRLGSLHAKLYNQWGATEVSIDSTVHVCTTADVDSNEVPVGLPIANNQVYVLDEDLTSVPVGVAGDLYLGGVGLARGYLNDPRKTAAVFLPSPFNEGERLYKVGDRGFRRSNGEVVFLGRADNQVKIRGIRIELGEVEEVIKSCPGVDAAVVVKWEPQPHDQRLAAFVVPKPDFSSVNELRDLLATRLPGYMVPASFTVLTDLPVLPNGKVDRKALPEPQAEAPIAAEVVRTPREDIVLGIVATLLGVPQVRSGDNFFELGGHSLLATRAVSALRAALGLDLEFRDFFDAPTLGHVVKSLDGNPEPRPSLRPRPRGQMLPLSFAQQRLWFLNRIETETAAHNVPVVVRLSGALDRGALELALLDVLQRHESLRTTYPHERGVPQQVVLDPAAVPLALEVVCVDRDEVAAAVAAAAGERFDLTTQLPLRATLLQLTAVEHLLVLVVHHIAGDGWSMDPLWRDLSEAYEARCDGRAPDWDPLVVQYADYTLWQRELLGADDDPTSLASRQLKYWRSALAYLPDELTLPSDRSRPEVPSHTGGVVEKLLPSLLHQQLVRTARATQSTLFMVLQAGLAALLTRTGAGTDIPVGTPVAGRVDAALDDLVGYFVNLVVLRTDTSDDPTFEELIGRVRVVDLAAYSNQDLPFDRLVEALNPVRTAAKHPLFQIMLALNNNPSRSLALTGLKVVAEPVPSGSSEVDLSFEFTETHDDAGNCSGIALRLEYSVDLFDPETAELLANQLMNLLASAASQSDLRISELDNSL